MSDFENRLNILKGANQIEEDSVTLANKIVKMLQIDYNIKLTEKNGSMLITHVVMANERIKKNRPVEKLSEFVIGQIKNDILFEDTYKITNQIIKLFEGKFIAEESDYIQMHVLNLLKGEK